MSFNEVIGQLKDSLPRPVDEVQRAREIDFIVAHMREHGVAETQKMLAQVLADFAADMDRRRAALEVQLGRPPFDGEFARMMVEVWSKRR